MAAEEEDIISTLPDEILCHILSFLQTNQSVATSILSKRWKNLCLSVPVLNIIVRDQNTFVGFIDFVYSIFLSRDSALPIKTFHLDFEYDNDMLNPPRPMDTITKWVNILVQCNVEYLNLSVELPMCMPKLPTSILTCRTLVVLKLFGFSVLEGISPVLLPSLKTLHLRNIYFPKLRDFMLFLIGCPILEDLCTLYVVFDSDESLTCDEWKSFYLSNLTRADIDCFLCHFPLKSVHNVPSLRLEIDQENSPIDSIPTFHNLTQLELICVSLHRSWKFLIQVLNHCPMLQKLLLDEVEHDQNEGIIDKENWVDPRFVPQCLSLHLRTCKFFSFSGLRGQIMLARFILKNAEVLQTMTIWKSGQSKIERHLSSSPMASASCKLIVYHVPYNREN